MEFVDSKKQKLNIGQIIPIFLRNTDQHKNPAIMVPAILSELSQPSVKTRQIGNTVFELITGKQGDDQAFFKAFNADTADNFVENSKQFVVWARRVAGLKILVTEFQDPALTQLFKVISMNPPMPKMGYKVYKTQNGGTRIVLNLGE
ncbi:hypothetical protein [Caudoviricetes sp.]|nr:hypothetical protein [Caudoviricetes sp.]